MSCALAPAKPVAVLIALAGWFAAAAVLAGGATIPPGSLVPDAGFRAHATPHYVLLTDPGAEPWTTGEDLEANLRHVYRVFEQAGFHLEPPRQRLVWIQFDGQRDFAEYSMLADGLDMSWAQGYYSVWTNRVALGARLAARGRQALERPATRGFRTAVFAGPDRASMTLHEAAHQIAFNSGLQHRGVVYPLWATEGMASYFESGGPAHPGLTGANPLRSRQLREAALESRLLPLRSFLTLTEVPHHDPELTDAVYAQSWAVFRTLFRERPAELRRYYEALSRLSPGARDRERMEREIVAAFGSLDRLEREWHLALARQLGLEPSASR